MIKKRHLVFHAIPMITIITSFNQDEVTHTYAEEGKYTITVTGTIKGWSFGGSGDRLKIQRISQWGNLKWGNSGSCFRSTENLSITAQDVPDLSGVTSMKRAFQNSGISSVSNMNDWDVSNVENMCCMFSEATSFNGDISDWDVSNVENMQAMFERAESLLKNPSKLKEIARNSEKAKHFIYYYRVSLESGLSRLRAYTDNFPSQKNVKIQQRSLLDIVSLREAFDDADAPEDVYVLSVLLTVRGDSEDESSTHKLPVGAYANGEWHFFVWPVP